MNKAVMIAVLFCLTSLTGCLGGDNLEIMEELEEEKLEHEKRINKLTDLCNERLRKTSEDYSQRLKTLVLEYERKLRKETCEIGCQKHSQW